MLLALIATIGPALLGLLLLLLRRWPRAVAVGGTVSTLLLALLTATGTLPAQGAIVELPFSDSTLQFGAGMQGFLPLVYVGVALLFLASTVWSQGSEFVPAGLVALSALTIALIAESLSLSALGLLAAAVPVTVMIQGDQRKSSATALRYLVATALALPLLLVAGWMLESEQAVFLNTIWRLLLVAVALLLASFPFQIWVRPLVTDAPPLVTVFVLTIAQLVIALFSFNVLLDQGLLESTQLATFLRWGASATAVLAGLLALTAVTVGHLLGYLLLADMAAILLMLSLGRAGLLPAVMLILLRFLSLLPVMIALHLLKIDASSSWWEVEPASLRQQPWTVVLLLFSMFSLIGLPLTPGFVARWDAISLSASQSIWYALPLLLALVGSAAGLLRGVSGWYVSIVSSAGERGNESLLLRLCLAFTLLVANLLALFPGLLLSLASTLAAPV